MGNISSDQGEQAAWNIIGKIPIVNLAYGLPRAVVYAAKGNSDQAVKTAIGIPGSIVSTGAFFVAGPGMGLMASTATGVFAGVAGSGYDLAKAASSAQQHGSVSLSSAQLQSLEAKEAINTQITELRSMDGRFKFVMQDDRNIVLYKHSKPIWASNTWTANACGPYKLYMQADGNLVAYEPNGRPFWASNTWHCGPGPFQLVMQDDGNCVLYDANHCPHWATDTWKHR